MRTATFTQEIRSSSYLDGSIKMQGSK
jgi:hypothetical protein